MSRRDGGPIMSGYSDGINYHDGLTVRDFFVAAALAGVVKSSDPDLTRAGVVAIVDEAFQIANAVMAQRERV